MLCLEDYEALLMYSIQAQWKLNGVRPSSVVAGLAVKEEDLVERNLADKPSEETSWYTQEVIWKAWRSTGS